MKVYTLKRCDRKPEAGEGKEGRESSNQAASEQGRQCVEAPATRLFLNYFFQNFIKGVPFKIAIVLSVKLISPFEDIGNQHFFNNG